MYVHVLRNCSCPRCHSWDWHRVHVLYLKLSCQNPLQVHLLLFYQGLSTWEPLLIISWWLINFRTLSSGSRVKVENEPILGYLSGSQERKELASALNELMNECTDVPLVINGKEFRNKNVMEQSCPFDHKKKIAKFYWATPVSWYFDTFKLSRYCCCCCLGFDQESHRRKSGCQERMGTGAIVRKD